VAAGKFMELALLQQQMMKMIQYCQETSRRAVVHIAREISTVTGLE
jgi:hypothetical protein